MTVLNYMRSNRLRKQSYKHYNTVCNYGWHLHDDLISVELKQGVHEKLCLILHAKSAAHILRYCLKSVSLSTAMPCTTFNFIKKNKLKGHSAVRRVPIFLCN